VTFKWPALKALLEPHTVEHNGGILAGFLVRCTASRKELGYVWQAGSAWRWQTPTRKNSGERSSQRAAVQVLREAYDLAHGGSQTLLDVFGDEEPVRVPSARPRPPLAKPLSSFIPRTIPPMKPRRVDEAPAPRPRARFELPANSDDLLPKKVDWDTFDTPTSDVTAAFADALKRTK
jgi:hypothetical protein